MWLAEDGRLPQSHRDAIADARNMVITSAAKGWKMAIDTALGKLTAPEDLTEELAGQGFDPLPIEVDDAVVAGGLVHHRSDPFDRMLSAQAVRRDLQVASVDGRFEAYDVCLLAVRAHGALPPRSGLPSAVERRDQDARLQDHRSGRPLRSSARQPSRPPAARSTTHRRRRSSTSTRSACRASSTRCSDTAVAPSWSPPRRVRGCCTSAACRSRSAVSVSARRYGSRWIDTVMTLQNTCQSSTRSPMARPSRASRWSKVATAASCCSAQNSTQQSGSFS